MGVQDCPCRSPNHCHPPTQITATVPYKPMPPEPEPEPDELHPRVSAAEAGRRIRLVATSIHGEGAAVLKQPAAALPAVPYSREAHLRLLQSQADAARLETRSARLEAGELALTAQDLVDASSRHGRLHDLAAAADHERAAMRELAEMKEATVRRMGRIAQDGRSVSKLQSELVAKRRELAAHADHITGLRRQAEAAEHAARTAMNAARAAALKLTNAQLSELRSMRKPPESVLVIIRALGLLLEDLASKTTGSERSQHKLLLKNPRRLRSRLKSLDVSSLGTKRVQALRKTLDSHGITLRTVPRLSVVCQALATFLLGVCSSWQASRDLVISQHKQQMASNRYDANAQAIIELEAKVEANREMMAALHKSHDEQLALQHDVASEIATAEGKLQKAESQLQTADGILRKINLVKSICDAVRHRHHKQLQSLLIQDRFSSAAGFFRGRTALHIAAETNNALAAAELLQQAGVHLMLQSWWDPATVFTWLLQRNAERNASTVNLGYDGQSEDEKEEIDPDFDLVPLAMIAELATDVAAPSSSVLELELIQPGLFDLISSQVPFEDTGVAKIWFENWWVKARPIRSPLWIAASHGYHETVQVMLTECDKQFTMGRGLFWGSDVARSWHTAVWSGHIKVVQCFGGLRCLDCKQLHDAHQYTALWSAIRLRNNLMVQCLCDLGCDVSDGGPAAIGESPLHLAVRLGDGGIVQTLVDAGADMLATDASGGTPCHTACRAGHDKLVELLYNITVDGEPVEVRDCLGRTALDVAIGCKHLRCCAEIVRIRHNRRLHSEWMTRSETVVASLPRAQGQCAPTNGQFLVGSNGWTLLHAATQMGLADTIKLTLEKCANQEVALKAKARDFSMSCSWTPMMLAVLGKGRTPEILQLLISASEASWCGSGIPPVQERNEENWDALWLASNEGHTQLVAMLLQAGSDPVLRDTQGINCLMAAALAGQAATSQLLMDTMFADGTPGKDMLATLSTVLFCGLTRSDNQLIETVLSLGVDSNKLDAFGQSAAEHAVAMDCTDDVLQLLARKGRARLWDPRGTPPGLPIVIHMDEKLDSLRVTDATSDRVEQFLNDLDLSVQEMCVGEPAWLVAIAMSCRRLALASASDKHCEGKTLESPSLQASYTSSSAGKLSADAAIPGGRHIAQSATLKLSDVVSQVNTARKDLLRHAEDEVSAMLSGKRAYKLSLHFHVITDVIGAAHAFFKRPALLKQICSQIDPLHRTPLHVAAQLGKADWVRVLIEAGQLSKQERKRMLDASDKFGRSVLHISVECASIEIARLILHARPQLLESETKRGHTARELASTLRRIAQTRLGKSRYVECWSRRLVANVSDDRLVEMEVELQRRRHMEDFLLKEIGAAGRSRRTMIKSGRWCLLIFLMPWYAFHTWCATIVLTTLCPTLREAPVLLLRLGRHRRFAVAYGSLMLSIAVVSALWCFGSTSERQMTQSLVLGCVGAVLLFQVITTCRVLIECPWRLFRPPPRATVALFHNGFDIRSTVWTILLMIELPQQAALAYVGASDGWFWMIPLLSPALFNCIDHERCIGDLRNLTENGFDLQQACDNNFCITCLRAGQCDTVCGYCDPTIAGIKPFELMLYFASAAAVAWICVASITGLSFGLVCAAPFIKRNAPRISADIWRMPSHDVWLHFFCRTIYVPVVMTLLRVADCRVSSTGSLNATSSLPWIVSDWEARHQWHEDTEIECWSGPHADWLVPSMVLMLVYELLAGVLPAMLQQPVPYGNITVAVPCTFDCISRFVKLLMVLCAVFSGVSTSGRSAHLVATCSALGGNLLLILAALCWPPSEHRTIRRLRLAIYCTASWVAATAILSVLVCSRVMVSGLDRTEPLFAVDYYSCRPSNLALAIGTLIGLAVSYQALESVTGLPPFARIARGARPSKVRATRIIPTRSPTTQTIKHGTWLGKLIGNLEASANATLELASTNAERRSLAW